MNHELFVRYEAKRSLTHVRRRCNPGDCASDPDHALMLQLLLRLIVPTIMLVIIISYILCPFSFAFRP